MGENKPKKPPGVRDIISDWATWIFTGLAIAYWILGLEKAKTDIIAAFGARVYAIITGAVLLIAIGFSGFGGPRLLKMIIDFKKLGNLGSSDDDKQENSTK